MAARKLYAPPAQLVHTAVLSTARLPGYMLLGLISTFVFRAVRDALPHDPAAQERILGASFTALAIADVRPYPPPCVHIPRLTHSSR